MQKSAKLINKLEVNWSAFYLLIHNKSATNFFSSFISINHKWTKQLIWYRCEILCAASFYIMLIDLLNYGVKRKKKIFKWQIKIKSALVTLFFRKENSRREREENSQRNSILWVIKKDNIRWESYIHIKYLVCQQINDIEQSVFFLHKRITCGLFRWVARAHGLILYKKKLWMIFGSGMLAERWSVQSIENF